MAAPKEWNSGGRVETFEKVTSHLQGVSKKNAKNHVRACVFSVFRTVKILNGYFLNSKMKRAQNSDSETHVKK